MFISYYTTILAYLLSILILLVYICFALNTLRYFIKYVTHINVNHTIFDIVLAFNKMKHAITKCNKNRWFNDSDIQSAEFFYENDFMNMNMTIKKLNWLHFFYIQLQLCVNTYIALYIHCVVFNTFFRNYNRKE